MNLGYADPEKGRENKPRCLAFETKKKTPRADVVKAFYFLALPLCLVCNICKRAVCTDGS